MGYRVARIVQPGKSNTKIAHGERFDIRTCTVSLAASDTAGFNVCPRAMPRTQIDGLLSAGKTWEQVAAVARSRGLSMCTASCVTNEAGKGAADFVREPRKNLTRWYRENRADFVSHLLDELRAECRRQHACGDRRIERVVDEQAAFDRGRHRRQNVAHARASLVCVGAAF